MIILVGASASGKTETAKSLVARHGMKKAVTCTTRPMRVGEKDGVDYFFLTPEEFAKKEANGFFVENTLYSGNHYGCGKDQIADDKCICVDPAGLKHFVAFNDDRIVSFFLSVPRDERAKRMKGRGDKPEDIEKRLRNDDTAFAGDGETVDADFKIEEHDGGIDEIADFVYGVYKTKQAYSDATAKAIATSLVLSGETDLGSLIASVKAPQERFDYALNDLIACGAVIKSKINGTPMMSLSECGRKALETQNKQKRG